MKKVNTPALMATVFLSYQFATGGATATITLTKKVASFIAMHKRNISVKPTVENSAGSANLAKTASTRKNSCLPVVHFSVSPFVVTAPLTNFLPL